MSDAIAVLNAGSSSLKFSVFMERGDALDLAVRGQAEGLYTSPRFVAKDGAGKVLGEKAWGDGTRLGSLGAHEHWNSAAGKRYSRNLGMGDGIELVAADEGSPFLRGAPSEDGRAADVVELTFRGVGDTPGNRYRVWIDRETRLVSQWAFFREAADAEPRFTLPWKDWQSFGSIRLATGRGRTDITGIRVSGDAEPASFDGP